MPEELNWLLALPESLSAKARDTPDWLACHQLPNSVKAAPVAMSSLLVYGSAVVEGRRISVPCSRRSCRPYWAGSSS